MPEVSIVFTGIANKTASKFRICGQDPHSDDVRYHVMVYKLQPPDEVAGYINRYNSTTHYLHLFGGTPDPYDTILNKWNATGGHLHRFEFDDSHEDPQNWFPVLHFWNCNPNLHDPNVNENSIIHFDGRTKRSAQPDDAFRSDVDEIAKSSHIVADMGARSLKQLVECVAQINQTSTGLLPAMLKETQNMQMALDRLRKRTNGKLPLIVRPDPVTCPTPERKSHPGPQ